MSMKVLDIVILGYEGNIIIKMSLNVKKTTQFYPSINRPLRKLMPTSTWHAGWLRGNWSCSCSWH